MLVLTCTCCASLVWAQLEKNLLHCRESQIIDYFLHVFSQLHIVMLMSISLEAPQKITFHMAVDWNEIQQKYSQPSFSPLIR